MVLTLDHIIWAHMLEERYLLSVHEEDQEELGDIEDFYSKISIDMYNTIDLLKTNVTKSQRKCLQSLITQNVN